MSAGDNLGGGPHREAGGRLVVVLSVTRGADPLPFHVFLSTTRNMNDPENAHEMFGVPGLARSFLLGSAIGGIGTFVVFAVVTYIPTQNALASFGVAFYTALWGGPGFGGMLGGVRAMLKDEHRPEPVLSPVVATPADTRVVLSTEGVTSAGEPLLGALAS